MIFVKIRDMKLIEQGEKISLAELSKMSEKMFGGLVKAVVDTAEESMLVDMEMHADGEQELLRMDSQQPNLWGINIHPQSVGDDFLEFDSVINLRPSQDNRSRGVDNPEVQKKIKKIVNQLIAK